MRLGIYCGSFNPIHKGHIRIAEECVKQGYVDKVMIIATGSYWNKNDLMPLNDRLNMLRLVAGEDIIIDDRYNEMPYTYQIFEKLNEDYPQDELVFVVGADNLLKFEDWKEYKQLLHYDFIVVDREDIDVPEQMKRLHKENYVILDLEKMDISSTFIRNHLDDYKAIKDMIDKKVYDYLRRRKS
ncbi:MAG: nicotinate (nicotinamide) nucleotide adenylyltransferase [Erysipelotrichaceae bacterium]|nr:nicotinate (nicotinamide) nucleotide adenylyltransferase [Erysipelotrichaceae bacterium]